MRIFIYTIIGVGIALSNPYKDLSEWDRGVLVAAWPGFIVRDIVNELHSKQALKEMQDAQISR